MRKRKKIAIIILSVFFGIFVIPFSAFLVYQENLRVNHPEEYTEFQAKLEQSKQERELQKEIDENVKKQEALQKEIEEIKAQELAESIRIQEEIKKAEQEKKLNTEEEVLKFIQNYKGKDNAGLTLDETLGTLMNAAYPGEDILSSPSTTGYYIASRDYEKEISDRYWKVEVKIQTYRETSYFEWIVDTETNSVHPGDEGGKSVLDILDSFD